MAAHINVKLFATLSAFKPESAERYEIAPGTTVRGLLARLKVPEDKARLVFVNSIKADLNVGLKDGDRVGIFPPVGGG